MRKNIIKSVVLTLLLSGSAGSVPIYAGISGGNYNNCFSAGERAFAVSDYALAAESFANALKYKPDDLRSRIKYAQALFSLNRYDESASNLNTVLQNSPNNIIARVFLAENYVQLDKKEAAKEQLEKILRIQPNHARALALYEIVTGTKAQTQVKAEEPQKHVVPSKVEESLSKKQEEKPVIAQEKEEKTENIEKPEKVEKNTEVVTKTYAESNLKDQSVYENDTSLGENLDDEDDEDQETNPISVISVNNGHKSLKEINKSSDKNTVNDVEASKDATEEVSKKSEEKSSEINKADSEMIFTPYIAGQKRRVAPKVEVKPVMPPANENIKNNDMQSFFKEGKSSFIVTLEKARYDIECGNLDSALKSIESADKIARLAEKNRNILEAQIFKSLVYIYQCEYTKFGKHLMTLKSVLSPESYQSFLDIYAQSDNLKNDDDKRRLSAGVAVGAGHYVVAANLLKPVFEKHPDDAVIYTMLFDAQLRSYDYDGAEKTLKDYIAAHPEKAEAHFNLARFYLTADYQPELARNHAKIASELNPNDPRNGIILGLTDYSEGKIHEGITRIKELLPVVEDNAMKAICQRLIDDGERASSKDAANNFINMLALPGAKHSHPSSFRFVGEDTLKVGSYFSAIDKFAKADENVEIGRAYLGLASALTNSGELEMASIAAGYGLSFIKADMSRGKNIARASLYKALYEYERGDKLSAVASIDLGLNCKDLDLSTYNKLVALYKTL